MELAGSPDAVGESIFGVKKRDFQRDRSRNLAQIDHFQVNI
jgi:hypothetical protein